MRVAGSWVYYGNGQAYSMRTTSGLEFLVRHVRKKSSSSSDLIIFFFLADVENIVSYFPPKTEHPHDSVTVAFLSAINEQMTVQKW